MNTFNDFFNSVITETYERKRYAFDRIPYSAQSIYGSSDGKLIREATTVAEGSHGSVSDDQEEFTEIPQPDRRKAAKYRLFNVIKNKEERALYVWARKKRMILSNEEFIRQWTRDGKKGEAEHEVYYDEPSHRWFKRNTLSLHSTFLEYFHRLALHNYLFPEAPVRLEGFLVRYDHLYPITSQPHVHATRGATQTEVRIHMKAMGFAQIALTDDYYNEKTGIRVEDLHDENVLISPEGDMYIVDPLIYLDDEGKKHRLAAYTKI